ncbi:MAG TPA: BlaI/MecI/CopY family transcriptional regulator [Pseudonocardiaceae bacterium]|jgi:predicted transcriptional regulator|nr:BlaI/MecI/CopY family transcriptional regulator [Pseudonocardiaceae bacterium]
MSAPRARRRAHGELEAEVTVALAAATQPVTVQEVQRSVDSDLSYNAVHTILNRLVEKGLVDRAPAGRGQVYRPARGAAEVIAAHMGALLDRGPSRTEVLRSFLGTLSDEDETLLRAWLDRRAS